MYKHYASLQRIREEIFEISLLPTKPTLNPFQKKNLNFNSIESVLKIFILKKVT